MKARERDKDEDRERESEKRRGFKVFEKMFLKSFPTRKKTKFINRKRQNRKQIKAWLRGRKIHPEMKYSC